MFPIFDANKARIALTYNGNSFGTGDHDDIIEIDGFSVRDVYSSTVEPWTDRNGFEAYRVHHNSKFIRIAGVVRGSNEVDALARFQTLAGYFNPHPIFADSPTSAGFANLTWTLNADTHLYEARAIQTPDLVHNIFHGANTPFVIDLLAKPWRKTNAVSAAIASGAVIANAGDEVGYPILTRVMSGAGSATTTLTNSRSSGSLVINLSTISSGTVTVNMETRSVTHSVNGDISHLIATANWWGLHPGNNTITFSGTTTNWNMSRYQQYWSK